VGDKACCRPQVQGPGDDAGGGGPDHAPAWVDSGVGAEPVRSVVPAVAVAGFEHTGTVVEEGWPVWPTVLVPDVDGDGRGFAVDAVGAVAALSAMGVADAGAAGAAGAAGRWCMTRSGNE
jgi:hypothetical protein